MKKILCSTIVIVLLIATPITALAVDPIEYGETVYGSISDSNWQEFWDFNGSSGDKITITMEATSGNLDPWLTLWKQDSNGDWSYPAMDNDSASGKDARITYTLQAGGRYVIETTRYKDKSGSTAGSYALTLRLVSGGSGSSGSSGGVGSSSSGYKGKPHDNWDDLVDTCPSGIRCIDSTSIQWPNLNALTYCVASSSGTTQQVGGGSITVTSDNAYENDLEDAIDYWDNLLTSFSMRQVSCSSNPDFIFGLIADADLQSVTGTSGVLGTAYRPTRNRRASSRPAAPPPCRQAPPGSSTWRMNSATASAWATARPAVQ